MKDGEKVSARSDRQSFAGRLMELVRMVEAFQVEAIKGDASGSMDASSERVDWHRLRGLFALIWDQLHGLADAAEDYDLGLCELCGLRICERRRALALARAVQTGAARVDEVQELARLVERIGDAEEASRLRARNPGADR